MIASPPECEYDGEGWLDWLSSLQLNEFALGLDIAQESGALRYVVAFAVAEREDRREIRGMQGV
jgi:hypothetical protein